MRCIRYSASKWALSDMDITVDVSGKMLSEPMDIPVGGVLRRYAVGAFMYRVGDIFFIFGNSVVLGKAEADVYYDMCELPEEHVGLFDFMMQLSRSVMGTTFYVRQRGAKRGYFYYLTGVNHEYRKTNSI